ncbi:MAG: dihydropteroate synthase-like protein [Methanobrevibacter sp.]
MKILIVTGNLAYPAIIDIVKDSKENVLVHKADTQVAAFLTPNKIINEVKNNYGDELSTIDMILVPGLIRKTTNEINEKLGIPTFKGPTDCADLGMVIDLINDLDLATDKAADKLIEEEKRKRAFQFIEDFENDTEKREELLKKPNNILVRNLPVGEDFPIRVLSEIANAPSLSKERLIKKCKHFVESGSDMIDIGMAAGEDNSDIIPDLIKTLRPIVGDRPLSIDTLNPKEIKVALENGIDLVLSLDLGHAEELVPLLDKYDVPAVLLPTNFAVNKVPHTIDERLEYIDELIGYCDKYSPGKQIDFIADLILDPVNSSSIVDSIIACKEFKEKNPYPLFFGVGNVTELMDTDSVGANTLLAGIAMEIGASVLFTPEESGKTEGSVYELAVASKMMFLAKNRSSIPKDLGINLLRFKDKKQRNDILGEEMIEDTSKLEVIKAKESKRFVRDRAGSFKIRVDYADNFEDRKIVVTHFKKTVPDIVIEGKYPKEIYDELVRQGLISMMDHAAYMGSELQKARIAMITGKEYVQDFSLFNKPLNLN